MQRLLTWFDQVENETVTFVNGDLDDLQMLYTHYGFKLEIDSEKVFPSKTRTKKKIATNITLNAANIGANFYGMNQPQHPHNPN